MWETRWVRDSEGEFALLNPATSAPERTSGAVARTMAVLRALDRLGPGQPLAAIAAAADLPPATVHRYLQALVLDGVVEHQGPRAQYSLASTLPAGPRSVTGRQPPSSGSPRLRAELVSLQSRTGQIALIYQPYLIGSPMRMLVEQACGAHSEELLTASQTALQALQSAPLDADVAGLAILACLGSAATSKIDISGIQEEGHAVGRSPLPRRTMIAAPLWFGSAVAGSVALLADEAQMRRASTSSRYITAVMDTAAAMSGQLTRSGFRRAC